MKFQDTRRQIFLNETAYLKSDEFIASRAIVKHNEELSDVTKHISHRSLVAKYLADYTYRLFELRYTAGINLETLQIDLKKVIDAYVNATLYARENSNDPLSAALNFSEKDQYERALQLISLCYLFRRTDLLPAVADMLAGYAALDTLVEDLFSYELEDRYEIDQWLHDYPYRHLINSFYRDNDEQSVADLCLYLAKWYLSFVDAPWHDSHLHMTNESTFNYSGYWAFEAGAAVVLLDLDDSKLRKHILYPKDAVDFARREIVGEYENAEIGKSAHGGTECPASGFWETPASIGSRRYFQKGEVMPSFDNSEYGSTIWQWSLSQE